jgi:hypothetical protein
MLSRVWVIMDEIWIGEWIYWPLIHTTRNYKQLNTTAPAKPFPTCYVFTSSSLATASNTGYSSASRAQVLPSQPPVQNSTELIAPSILSITSRHEPYRKHRFCIVAFVSAAAGTCLPSRRPETAAARASENAVLLLLRVGMLRELPGNGRCLQSHCLATGVYASILCIYCKVINLIIDYVGIWISLQAVLSFSWSFHLYRIIVIGFDDFLPKSSAR